MPVRTAIVAMALATMGVGAATAAAPAPTQEIAILLGPQSARIAPTELSPALQRLAATRPITGERTSLPVTGHETAAGGAEWLHVRLPGRPNGRSGWIRKRGTTLAETPWRIVVDIAARRVTVLRDGHPARAFDAVVGKTSTPTPRGEFFVEESVELRPGDAGAPYALALSARSSVLQKFDGGPGQIALHGLANVGGTLGTAVSHGCVRLDAAAMRWLAVRIGPGVPVTVTG